MFYNNTLRYIFEIKKKKNQQMTKKLACLSQVVSKHKPHLLVLQGNENSSKYMEVAPCQNQPYKPY